MNYSSKYLIGLELKEFFRSRRFAKRIVLKILVVFAYLYFGLVAILMGVGGYYAIKEELPEENTFLFGNRYLLYFFFIFFILYLFLSPSPSMKVRPLMILPIKKKRILNYFLLKLNLNYLSLFAFTIISSYTVVLFLNEKSRMGVLLWFFSVIAVILSLVFIALLMEKSYKVIAIVVVIFAAIFGLKHYGILDIPDLSGRIFYSIYENPWLSLVAFGFLTLVFAYTYKWMMSRFYLDGALKVKSEKVLDIKLSWLDRFGTTSIFLKNDIRMILRNKRPRKAALFSLYFLLYGFWVFGFDTNNTSPNIFKLLFGSMLITGGFLFSFGNYVPAWDSEYIRLFMSQNIKYSQYLDSKWWLMVVSVVFLSILSIPFIYYGIDKYILILAMAVFNIGFNSYLVLIGGLFNDSPIHLNEKVKAFQNTQGFNINSFLLGMLRLLLPILVYYLAHKYYTDNIGLLLLAGIGLTGVLLKSKIMSYIESLYRKKKYSLLESFAKEE